jgi:hypothetical protein
MMKRIAAQWLGAPRLHGDQAPLPLLADFVVKLGSSILSNSHGGVPGTAALTLP